MPSEVQNQTAVYNSLTSLYDHIYIYDLVCDAGKAAHSIKKIFFNKNMVTVYCGSSRTGKFLSDD